MSCVRLIPAKKGWSATRVAKGSALVSVSVFMRFFFSFVYRLGDGERRFEIIE
jgi:hypothetical protein